tara:strand:+ start:16459 stop:17007 length:549 start_codon:yes stop_codon:yes gene_type:complete
MEKLKKISQEKFDSLKKEEKDLILNYYNIFDKEQKLSKKLDKLRIKTKKVKKEFNEIKYKRKEILKKVKLLNNKLFITSSIVCDKRWNSYICIFKNSVSQKSLYLGSHNNIINALSPFYLKEEFEENRDFLKKELKKIISAVQDKLISLNEKDEIIFKKNKLKNIVDLYAESGQWDYWSIQD